MSKHIIHGAPGTGKTTTLMNIMEKQLNKGIPPSDIAFCTFTKSAAEEAKERATGKFNLSKDDIDYFGTIHSICNKRFCHDFDVVRSSDKKEFFEKINVGYDISNDKENLLSSETKIKKMGNLIMNFYDKIRLHKCMRIFELNDLKKHFFDLPLPNDKFTDLFVSSFDLRDILESYEKFKSKNDMVDFIDMLIIAYRNEWIIPTKILIVDEFQDLSPLQYKLYKLWSKDKDEIYIAGDDDQTIYSFICADPDFLLKERKELDKSKGDEEIILDKTYRLPNNIHAYCSSYIKDHIIGERVDKNVKAFDKGGEVVRDNIDKGLEKVLDYIRDDKETFILFRTKFYKRSFINEVLIPNGVLYKEMKNKLTSLWNNRTITLFNACVKLYKKEALNYEEVERIINNIPYKLGFLERGLKTHFKDKKKKKKYSISDLLELGFDVKLFNTIDSYDKLFNILKLRESTKIAFKNHRKEVIEGPIKLRLGTIHSSKGKEADDVIIFKDVNKKVVKSINDNKSKWDDEIRVFYVGMTRAKERLVILRDAFEYSNSKIIP